MLWRCGARGDGAENSFRSGICQAARGGRWRRRTQCFILRYGWLQPYATYPASLGLVLFCSITHSIKKEIALFSQKDAFRKKKRVLSSTMKWVGNEKRIKETKERRKGAIAELRALKWRAEVSQKSRCVSRRSGSTMLSRSTRNCIGHSPSSRSGWKKNGSSASMHWLDWHVIGPM
eukprot:3839285-Prymnesium_polylepis.1